MGQRGHRESAKTAEQLGVGDEDRVAIDFNGHTAWGAIWRVPGQPDGSIALSLGYGRRRSGRAGNGAGFDVYPLRAAANPYFGQGAKVRKLGESSIWPRCRPLHDGGPPACSYRLSR